jgi:hypothetical protein
MVGTVMAEQNQTSEATPRSLDKAAWLRALDALEQEFLAFRNARSDAKAGAGAGTSSDLTVLGASGQHGTRDAKEARSD